MLPITPISHRFIEVLDRIQPGHWEGDCIVGAFNRSAIATLVERTTRFTILAPLVGKPRAVSVRYGLMEVSPQLAPALRRSLTWDQGSEMSHHYAISQAAGMNIYFRDAGKPWQRPTNENTNDGAH